jgi:hypothetical protein
VIVNVQDALTLDFELTVGSVTESVTVEAGEPVVNTQSGAVSTVVDRTFVANLPLNGRSFQTLIMLTPGVVVTPSIFNDQGQFSVNGQRADANYFTVDGVSANFGVTGYIAMGQTASGALPALSASGGTNSLVSADALQEFRIQTSSVAPEFGRTPGGQVAIVTRSGTNTFQGSVFEYFRNSTLDAEDWFVESNGLPKPEERQNNFGGVFGGPLIRDKTFMFLSYEGQRLQQPSSLQTAVPDVQSRLAAPAALRPYLSVFPAPNGPELGAGLAQFSASFSNPSSLDATSVRLDHVVNASINLFGRYNYSPSSIEQRGPTFPSGRVLSSTNVLSSSVHTATFGSTQLIGPTVSNEVRANYSTQSMGTIYLADPFGGAAPLPDNLFYPSTFSTANSNFILVVGGAGEFVQGQAGTDTQRQINVVDSLSVMTSSHQLKFGVDYRRLAPTSDPFVYRQFVQFSGMSSTTGGVLSGAAQFAQASTFQPSSLLSHNVSLFGQDTWRLTSSVTLTYGLRWDINPPPTGTNLANTPFTVIGLDHPATMTLAPRGTPLYETTYGNVAPRVGLAYQLNGLHEWSAVIRSGFGVFYDLGQGSLGGVSSYFPYQASNNFSPAPFPFNPANAAAPVLTTTPPVGIILLADPHLKVPRTYQWNVALEQSLGNRQSVSLTYIGAAGRDLLRVTDLYNVNPSFQSVSVTDNTAASDYHGLQFKFERRLSHGFQALASYTWSHSTDIASTDAVTHFNTPGLIDDPNRDRGDSDFDIRHSFSGGVTYALPSPAAGAAARAILANWSVDAFVLARSAPPVDVVGALSITGNVVLSARPNVNPGVPQVLYGDQYPGGMILNGAAFTPAPGGQQGDLERNVLRGFGASQCDLAFQKSVGLAQRTALRFRVEIFNVFNQANFGSPTNLLTSPLFGRSTQTLANSLGPGGANGGFSPLYQIGGPRTVQLALRLQF